jgi:hypothetical protein
MMRRRLRDMPTADELAKLYAVPHNHHLWVDHLYRVDVTSAMAGLLLPPGGRVADLSCGDAEIARRLEKSHGAHLQLGDFAPSYEHTGPIEKTIKKIYPVDLFILSETLEHLDDPDAVLRAIRPKTGRLILSTPDGEDNDQNPEHVWGWDAEAVEDMLRKAAFKPQIHTTVDTRPSGAIYSYQIWACS